MLLVTLFVLVFRNSFFLLEGAIKWKMSIGLPTCKHACV